jgi:hypothetical protein
MTFGLSDGGPQCCRWNQGSGVAGEIEPNLRGRWFGAEQD